MLSPAISVWQLLIGILQATKKPKTLCLNLCRSCLSSKHGKLCLNRAKLRAGEQEMLINVWSKFNGLTHERVGKGFLFSFHTCILQNKKRWEGFYPWAGEEICFRSATEWFLFVMFQVCCNGVLLGSGSWGEAKVPAACPVPHRVPCSSGSLCLNSSLRFCSGPLVIDQHYSTTRKTAPDWNNRSLLSVVWGRGGGVTDI